MTIVLFFFTVAASSQLQSPRVDTIKAQLLISSVDTLNKPFMQVPIFARNGYVIIKKEGNKNFTVIGFLDWFKQSLPGDEKVWQYRPYK